MEGVDIINLQSKIAFLLQVIFISAVVEDQHFISS